ncbi:MAG: hypothetical protein ABI301_01995 [Jatrophihabitantaceae bacterium]
MVGSHVSRAGVFVVAAGVVLAGCSNVVDGAGRLAAGRSSSPDFPSASIPVPPTSPSPSTAPTGSGPLVTYASGHFRARFPYQPVERTDTGSEDGFTFVTHTAATHEPPTLVAAEDISQPLPESAYPVNLRAAVGSFAASSGLTLRSQAATTFQGHVAQAGSLGGPAGESYTLVAFAYSSKRLYLLIAPAGTSFREFARSFVALP